jgi:pyruvate dehydrogenase E1 component alpha subunit
VSTASPETLLGVYRTMATIRAFEERVAREFRTGEVPGFVHMYIGEEGVAAGVCAHLTDADFITSTHRGHGHAIAKGCDLRAMMAEIYGRETGLCHGRGGSMHVADFSLGMLGANARTDQVAVSFFGDGAANQGVFHESLNLAAIWRLPVVYVCENNGFAESTPAAYATSVDDIAARAASYDIPGVVADSSDVMEVFEVAGEAVARARRGEGPTLLEAKTYRIRGHFEGDPELYRDDDERGQMREHDPIPPFRSRLIEAGAASAEELDALERELETRIDDAVEYAVASPWPDPAAVGLYVYPEGAEG